MSTSYPHCPTTNKDFRMIITNVHTMISVTNSCLQTHTITHSSSSSSQTPRYSPATTGTCLRLNSPPLLFSLAPSTTPRQQWWSCAGPKTMYLSPTPRTTAVSCSEALGAQGWRPACSWRSATFEWKMMVSTNVSFGLKWEIWRLPLWSLPSLGSKPSVSCSEENVTPESECFLTLKIWHVWLG